MGTFLTFGHYIMEPTERKEYTKLSSPYILTACSCLCDSHPDFGATFWVGHEKNEEVYRKALQLPRETFYQLKEEIGQLFEEFVDIDGRFKDLQTAIHLKETYYKNVPAMILSYAIEESLKDDLLEEMDHSKSPDLFTEELKEGEFLGYDILGWDIGGFHSWLCNGLEKEIQKEYALKVNEWSLIQNSYEEVLEFTDLIQGKGEPVVWFPFGVYLQEK